MEKIKTSIKTVIIFVLTAITFTVGAAAADKDGAVHGYIQDERTVEVFAKDVYLGGIPFGVRLYSGELRVIGFANIDTNNGGDSPAYDAGIREGDVILSVNGTDVKSASDLIEACESSEGNQIIIKCKRGDGIISFSFKPSLSESEKKYKTGMWIKDSTAGIGTVTYIVPDTKAFAGLGHCICNSATGEPERVSSGTVMDVEITGVEKAHRETRES